MNILEGAHLTNPVLPRRPIQELGVFWGSSNSIAYSNSRCDDADSQREEGEKKEGAVHGHKANRVLAQGPQTCHVIVDCCHGKPNVEGQLNEVSTNGAEREEPMR